MVVYGHIKSSAGIIEKMGDLGNKVSLREIGKIDSKGKIDTTRKIEKISELNRGN